MSVRKSLLVVGLVVPALPGCAFLRGVSNFISPTVAHVSRPQPAEKDLPTIQTIAMARLQGRAEDVQAISGTLGERLTQSQRFRVVEREQLDTLSKENGCQTSSEDYTCLSKTLPASAVIIGSISEANYKEGTSSEHYECGDGTSKKTCTTFTRTGNAHVTANLRLVETASGRVLAQRLSTKTASASTTGSDEAPPSIDSNSLLDQARALVAQDFFELISPHQTTETIELAFDVDLPLLDRGNDQMKRSDFAAAVGSYRSAVKQADGSSELDAGIKAKAHYDLAVGLLATADFDDSVKELARALQLKDDDDWRVLSDQLGNWRNDAAAVKRQLAYATPTPVEDSVTAPSASAAP
jgi:tetratricopeptide (TPR) repeat protein